MARRSSTPATRLAAGLAILAALSLIGLGAARLTVAAVAAHTNADLLYVAAVYRDLVEHRAMARWHLPPAPYFFPDMALLFPLWLALGRLDAGYVAYGLALFALWMGVAYFLARSLGLAAPRAVAATLGGALVFVACMQESHVATRVFFLPIFHAGATVVGVALVALAIRIVTRAAAAARATDAAFFALAVAITLSDLFSVTQFVLPLALVLWLLVRDGTVERAGLRRVLALLAASALADVVVLTIASAALPIEFVGNPVLAGARALARPWPLVGFGVAGLVAWRLRARIAPHHVGIAIGVAVVAVLAWRPSLLSAFARELRPPPGWPRVTAVAMERDLVVLARHDPALWLVAALCPLACVVELRSTARDAAARARRVLAAFVLASTAAILIEAALTWVGLGSYVFPHLDIFNEGTVRHVQPLYVLPPFVLAFLVAARPLPRPMVAALCAALLPFAAWRIARPAPPWTAPTALTAPSTPLAPALGPGVQRCVDAVVAAHHLHVGYGDYWTARHLTLLSDGATHLTPLRLRTMEPETWVENPARFLPDAPDGTRSAPAYFRYDYFVASRFPVGEIEARFGPPRLRADCSDLAILVYDRETDVAFRHFLYVPALVENGADPRAPLPLHATDPRLARWRPDGAPEDDADTTRLDAAHPVTVRFPGALVAPVVELSATAAAAFAVTPLGDDDRPLATLQVAPTTGAGLRARYLRVPENTPVRAVRVAPTGTAPATLAYVYLYPDTR